MSSTDDTRKQQILKQVNATPGANLRQVQRYTNLPLSTTARLLNELEEEGKIESGKETAYRRFFPIGKRLHKRERVLLGFVNKPRPRAILQHLLANPGIRHGDLADAVGLPAPTLTYYMKQIVAEDVVKVRKKGATRMYRVKNPALVKKALSRTSKGFDKTIAKG